MAKVPALAVPVVREFLHELGISTSVVKNDGTINTSALVGEVVHEVEVTTALTPPVRKTLQQSDALPPDRGGRGGKKSSGGRGLGAKVGALIKPTVRIRGVFGERVISPYGSPIEGEWKRNVLKAAVVVGGVVVGLVTVGFIIGRVSVGRPSTALRAVDGLGARSVGGPVGGGGRGSVGVGAAA